MLSLAPQIAAAPFSGGCGVIRRPSETADATIDRRGQTLPGRLESVRSTS